MPTVKVKLAKRSYDIVIGNKITGSLDKYLKKLKLGNFVYIITNTNKLFNNQFFMDLYKF